MANERVDVTRIRSGRSAWSPANGWPGVVLLAATYVYFLIFAQFGFLKRLGELGLEDAQLKPVMGAMAVGGILMSLGAPRARFWTCPKCRVQTGLLGCAVMAAMTLLTLTPMLAMAVAAGIGLSLGLLTVTLVANLPHWIGTRRPLMKIALGTGLGYAACNVPWLFDAGARGIAWVALGVCLLATAVANRAPMLPVEDAALETGTVPFGLGLGWFTALVWLDSAAFFIIQNSPELKAGTWQGDMHLWRTGALHLVGTLTAGLLLARGRVRTCLGLAFGFLAGSCWLLGTPGGIAGAALLYPVGVSLYSVALVACPAYLIMSRWWDERGRRAGLLYAVAGWTGSALGIGMGQNLHAVPMAFVAAAAVLFVVPWVWRLSPGGRRQAIAVALVCAVAWGLQRQLPQAAPASAETTVEAGRRVYIAEGCIHCHSQYVRPGTRDVAMWGPVRPLAEVKAEEPPLIGNRRQGPDLSQVGSRRSVLWLRLHTMDPRAVSARSIMPGYGYLWARGDGRGEELVAYLASLTSAEAGEHYAAVTAAWKPSDEDFDVTRRDEDGERLFTEHCGTCHLAGGQARGMGRSMAGGGFKRMPPNLFGDAWFRIAPGLTESQERVAVGRVVKYGLPGTDMPGLEYLPDGEVEAIADWVTRKRSETLAGRAAASR